MPVKECPDCTAIIPLATHICPICGHKFPFEVKKRDINEHDGQISEINVTRDNKKNDAQPIVKRRFSKPEEFLIIAKQWNYKIGWVAFKSLPFAQSYDDCLHIANICGYNKGWAWHNWQQRLQELGKKKSLQKVSVVC